MKTKKCKLCSERVECPTNVKSVTCWKCTHFRVEGYTELEIKTQSKVLHSKILTNQ